MRRLGLVLIFLFLLAPALIQAQSGATVLCGDGTSFNGGVTVTIKQMRSGVSYKATALGLNGFNPMLAVLDPAGGKAQCNDDNTDAGRYAAYLPSAGTVPPSNQTAQISFSQTSNTPQADVVLVIGSASGQPGEFLLYLEGLAISSDNPQDAVSIALPPNQAGPLTAYMFKEELSDLDAKFAAPDSSISCDDAGSVGLCQTNSVNLVNYSVTLGSQIQAGHPTDAMLSLPTQTAFSFVMSASPQKPTHGGYFLVFDIGKTPAANSLIDTSTQTVSITCADGTHFDTGVAVIIRHLPLGFNVTATAVGLNGFAPVLAVVRANGASCASPGTGAARYSADLPTTGSVPASRASRQIAFSQITTGFADVTFVVGSPSQPNGQFLLFLEDMSISGSGRSAFSVQLPPNLKGMPFSVYLFARDPNQLDPYLYQADNQLNPVTDSPMSCDNAGTSCAGSAVDLSKSSLHLTTGTLTGQPTDAMLSFSSAAQNEYSFVVASSPQKPTHGQYVLVFQFGQGS